MADNTKLTLTKSKVKQSLDDIKQIKIYLFRGVQLDPNSNYLTMRQVFQEQTMQIKTIAN